MLSRSLRRVLLDTKVQLPPTFLLPWTANLSTAPGRSSVDAASPPLSTTPTQQTPSSPLGPAAGTKSSESKSTGSSASQNSANALPSPSSSTVALSPTVRELLPLLQSQAPHYITIHIHGNPYLVTEGDTIRLPFHMHGVSPGDVLRLNRAVNLGSRDYTLKAAAPSPKLRSATATTVEVLDPTSGVQASHSRVMPMGSLAETAAHLHIPHFIPHIAKGKHSYLDDRLFVCRAVVMGVESEPMRKKEKTKRRQRHVRTVKSKHRFTIIKIKELRVKGVEEIEAESSTSA